MRKPDHEETIEFRGKYYLLKEYFNSDFNGLRKPSQSYGIILNNNNDILLISEDNIKWTLPGGTIEPDETPEQALIREIYEESAVAIDENYILPFYYNVAYEVLNGKLIYSTTQLRFISRAKQIDDFIKDPGGNVQFRQFVPFEDFDKILSWKKIGPIIKEHLKNYI